MCGERNCSSFGMAARGFKSSSLDRCSNRYATMIHVSLTLSSFECLDCRTILVSKLRYNAMWLNPSTIGSAENVKNVWLHHYQSLLNSTSDSPANTKKINECCSNVQFNDQVIVDVKEIQDVIQPIPIGKAPGYVQSSSWHDFFRKFVPVIDNMICEEVFTDLCAGVRIS